MSKHLSRLAAPKSWPISRKGTKWIAKANPGPHNKNNSIALVILLRDILKISNDTREVKKIINSKKVLINNKPARDHKLAVGLMDILSIPQINKSFMVIINKKRQIQLQETEEKEKYCKIKDKRILKKNQIQLNLHDGKNILTKDKKYKPGDTLIIDIEKNDIKKHLELKKGALVYLTGGKHVGHTAQLEEIKGAQNKQNKIIVKLEKNQIEVKKDHIFVTDKPIIK